MSSTAHCLRYLLRFHSRNMIFMILIRSALYRSVYLIELSLFLLHFTWFLSFVS